MGISGRSPWAAPNNKAHSQLGAALEREGKKLKLNVPPPHHPPLFSSLDIREVDEPKSSSGMLGLSCTTRIRRRRSAEGWPRVQLWGGGGGVGAGRGGGAVKVKGSTVTGNVSIPDQTSTHGRAC